MPKVCLFTAPTKTNVRLKKIKITVYANQVFSSIFGNPITMLLVNGLKFLILIFLVLLTKEVGFQQNV